MFWICLNVPARHVWWCLMLCYTWDPSRLCQSFTESQKPPSQRFPHPGHCFCLVHVHVETQPEQSISTNALGSCNVDPRDVTNWDQAMRAIDANACRERSQFWSGQISRRFSEGGNSGLTMIQRTKEYKKNTKGGSGGRKRKRPLRSQGLGKALTCSEAMRARQFWRLWRPWHQRHGHICSGRDYPGASADADWCVLTVFELSSGLAVFKPRCK